MLKTLVALLAAAAIPMVALAQNYAVSGQISGSDGGWDYASVDAEHGQLYVARRDAVSVADLSRRDGMRSIGQIAHGHAAVPLPDGRLLVTSGGDDSVRLINPVLGTELARIPVGSDPDAAFYDPAGRHAVVMNAKAGTVSVLDVTTAKVVRTISLKPALEFGVLGPRQTLFVNDEDANEIEVADLATGKVSSPIRLPGCEGPTGLGYDAAGGRLISACANGKAAIVDIAKRRQTQLLAIGLGPDAVIMDTAHRRAFIPCGRSGVLEMLSLGSRGKPVTVSATIKTEVGARTGALDPRDGTIYLPTAGFSPPAAGGRRVPVPGSFHVLIVKAGAPVS